MIPILVVAGSLFGIVMYVIANYNFFKQTEVRIEASIQEIGNQLKRQASLIPNLTSSAKSYLKHEKEIYKQLTDARKAVEAASNDQSKVDSAMNQLQAVLPKLQVLVESNPELKADQVVQKLMAELRDTADKLLYARRTLIDLAADYNTKVEMFPSNLVAKLFAFEKKKGLETPMSGEHVTVSNEEMKEVKVDLD